VPSKHSAAPRLPARSLYLLLSAAVLLADRLTKMLVESSFTLHEIRTVIPGFFQLVYVRNPGIAFSLLADSPSPLKTFVLVGLSLLALAAVAWLLWTADPALHRLCTGLALIMGGAMGNLLDRILDGSVVDFLDFFISTYHWPAFNVADSAIVAGGGLVLFHTTRYKKGGGRA